MNDLKKYLGIAALAACLGGGARGTEHEQYSPRNPQAAYSISPQRDTLRQMMQPISAKFEHQRLEDVLNYLADVTHTDIEVMWADERNVAGLDKELSITYKIDNRPALFALEGVLEKAVNANGASGNSWQLTKSGTLQIGPEARLNNFTRIELYPIQDILREIPDYANAPELDLQGALQSQGSQSLFREANQQQQNQDRPLEERAQDIIKIVTDLVEPEQWVNNGGDGASIRHFQGSLIIKAPDYIHRQINGYP